MSSNSESIESNLSSSQGDLPPTDYHAWLKAVQTNFTCGGSLLIDSNHQDGPVDGQAISCPPIVVRFDGPGPQKVQFPLPKTADGQADEGFTALLARCQAASFGRRGEDVVDESYRRAVKLDNKDFSVNFHPHDYGIVDTISQTLFSTLVAPRLPSETDKTRGNVRTRFDPPMVSRMNKRTPDFVVDNKNFGVVAKLYKINVYSGPSGHFKAHVDTPRSPRQFGSLVICLPCKHEDIVSMELTRYSKQTEADNSVRRYSPCLSRWCRYALCLG